MCSCVLVLGAYCVSVMRTDRIGQVDEVNRVVGVGHDRVHRVDRVSEMLKDHRVDRVDRGASVALIASMRGGSFLAFEADQIMKDGKRGAE